MHNYLWKFLVCYISSALVSGCSLEMKLSELSPSELAPISVQISTEHASLNSLSSFLVELSFSSEVLNLTEDYIQIVGGTLVPGSLTGSGKKYSVSVTPSGEGLIHISFPEQNISVLGSSDSKKTSSTSTTVTVDTTSPTVQLTTAVVSPTPLTSIPVTVTFSEAVSINTVFTIDLLIMRRKKEGMIRFLLEAFASNFGPGILKRVTQAHGKDASVFWKVHAEEDQDHIQKAFKQVSQLPDGHQAETILNFQHTSNHYLNILKECAAVSKKIKIAA